MNLQEFAALKVGDHIENVFSGGKGEVMAVTNSGVRVRWPPSHAEFEYLAMSTAWMHWSKVPSAVSPELDAAIEDELQNPPGSIMK